MRRGGRWCGFRRACPACTVKGLHRGDWPEKMRCRFAMTTMMDRCSQAKFWWCVDRLPCRPQNFGREALGFDAEVTVQIPKLRALQLAGEVVIARNLDRGLFPADPVASGRDLRELGYYAQMVQEITLCLLGVRYDVYGSRCRPAATTGVMRTWFRLCFRR